MRTQIEADLLQNLMTADAGLGAWIHARLHLRPFWVTRSSANGGPMLGFDWQRPGGSRSTSCVGMCHCRSTRTCGDASAPAQGDT